METLILAGGCFWCIEAIFKDLKGVESVVSGYSGGEKENPTYEEVSNGTTGYAEAIEVTFDPSIISRKDILEIFFKIHDPTTLNRQGADVGTQYRSAVFYKNEDQKKTAEEVIQSITGEKVWNDPIVTEVTEFRNFYKAEDYHQDYFANNSRNPYCMIVIDPKVKKFRKEYAEKLKN